jgi:hypothetical protein
VVGAEILLSAILLTAGVGKLADRRTPAILITNLVTLPFVWATTAALLLALTEIMCALLIAATPTRPVGLALASVLASLFVAVGLASRRFGVKLACGCFGPATPRMHAGWPNVVLGVAILVTVALALRAPATLPPTAVASIAASATLLVFAATAWRAIHSPAQGPDP